ncbi:ComF family protein [Paenibacillus alba]|uniref:ComF family protein n=1 Tax=Paenibacillus alba TaxID=1197127 RepID=UPI00156478ED|nr:ComF family protein [Paenibacillus alba]
MTNSGMGHWIKKAWTTLASMLSPVKADCLLCKKVSELRLEQLGLCISCYQKVPWIQEVLCPTCGRSERCWDCQRRQQTYFIRSRSAVRYDDAMKELLARYKYRRDERLKTVIGRMLVHAYHLSQLEQPKSGSDPAQKIITFVPVSERRMLERGFNQADQMATELGRRIGVPVIPLLNRSKHTDKQSIKKRNERLDDLEHVFEIDLSRLDIRCSTTALHIYLVDDVYTTGSTMNQCAKVLKAHFSAEVVGLTWAR